MLQSESATVAGAVETSRLPNGAATGFTGLAI